MRFKKKICFIGNCQTAFMSSLIKHHSLPVCQIDLPVAYLANLADKEMFVSSYEEADIIVTRLMSDRVQSFVSTSWLRENYGNKLVVIPNIYFNGFDPDLRRIYDASGKVIRGPLGDYSCNMIHFSYVNGWSQDSCAALLKRNDILEWYPDSVAKSLAAQRARENSCDLRISDYIESMLQVKRLFYTFNHPTNDLLLELFHRLMSHIDISGSRQWSFDDNFLRSNALSYVIAPIHPAIQRRYCTMFETSGFEFRTIFSADGAVIDPMNLPVYHSTYELVSMFYKVYEEAGVPRG